MSEEEKINLNAYTEKTISKLDLKEDDKLVITFSDGTRIKIFDDGQSCCEDRWMTCDDALDQFIGSKLIMAECLEAESVHETSDEVCETMFLRVVTNQGSFRLCMHNTHNGYYSGFSPKIEKDY